MEKDIAELRKKAEEELLDELTKAQREKFLEMQGDKYESQYERRMRDIEEDEID